MSAQRAVVTASRGVTVADVAFHGLVVPDLPGVVRAGERLDDGAVVRVTATAVCGSDLHVVDNPATPAGQVCGHEAAGVVEAIGPDVRGVAVGDAVVVPFNVACGRCDACARGRTAHCATTNPHRPGATYGMGTALGGWPGLQAERCLVPYADGNLVVVRERDWALTHPAELVLVADLLPTGYHAATRALGDGAHSAYVAGAGPVGLATALCLRHLGVRHVVVGDVVTQRRERAAEVGFVAVDPAAAPGATGLADLLEAVTGARVVDAAVDCVGLAAPDLLGDLLGVLAPHGRLVLTGAYPREVHGRPTVLPLPLGELWTRAVTVHSGATPARPQVPAVLDLVRSGAVTAADLGVVTRPLEDAAAAYAAFRSGVPAKQVLLPETHTA